MTTSIPESEWRSLKEVNGSKGAATLLLDWLVISLSILVFSRLNFWFLYPVLVVVIGSRMMGLWALLHDGHHNMLVRSRSVNRKLTEWLIAWPLFKSLQEYDEQHGDHHKHLGGEGDPNFHLLRYNEFQFPMKRSKLIGILLKDLFGINFIYYRILGLIKNPLIPIKKVSSWNFERTLFVALVFTLVTFFNLWLEFILFWIVPLVTYFQFLIRVTLISDHCFAETEPQSKVRTVELNAFERMFMVPHNLNYHYEHHNFGRVPSYNLHKLHSYLKSDPDYLKNSDFSEGYFQVLKKVTIPG